DVILPDETAASMRVVASATRSLMIFWGSTFLDLASAAMLWPPCSAVFSSAGVMLRSFATMSRDGLAPSLGVRVPLTKAVAFAVRPAFILVAWSDVIFPDETAASMRVVASATTSLMIFWGSTFGSEVVLGAAAGSSGDLK